ncbi:MAG TPA: Crp/Fnr family transcriptional regulator [Streptosporangiaceae bacterium]|nr:Crp/Fnr family transcriptional regulator [Streptosporangiaceae bacterium]
MPDRAQTAKRVARGGEVFTAVSQAVLVCGFAGRLSPVARGRLLTLGTSCRFRPGELLLREGEVSNHVLLLTHGRVKLTSTADNGYAVVLGILGPGDLVGEMAGLGGHPRTATVVALDPVLARFISGSDFRSFIDGERGAGIALAELIASRLRDANRRCLEFGAFPVRRRLALILLDLDRWHGVSAPGDGNLRDINLALSQADLAGLVGSSLESVAKAIRNLVRQGVIRTRRRHVTILDRAALAELANKSP